MSLFIASDNLLYRVPVTAQFNELGSLIARGIFRKQALAARLSGECWWLPGGYLRARVARRSARGGRQAGHWCQSCAGRKLRLLLQSWRERFAPTRCNASAREQRPRVGGR